MHIWIDSIRIDQQNTKEKSPQVVMMASIYPQAICVLIPFQGSHNEKAAYWTAMI